MADWSLHHVAFHRKRVKINHHIVNGYTHSEADKRQRIYFYNLKITSYVTFRNIVEKIRLFRTKY